MRNSPIAVANLQGLDTKPPILAISDDRRLGVSFTRVTVAANSPQRAFTASSLWPDLTAVRLGRQSLSAMSHGGVMVAG
jgi:hypothetical protein